MTRTLAVLAILGLAGCSQADPFTREGMWQPEGVNSRNLAAMVANPADLRRGHGDPGFPGARAAAAVTRLQLGKTVPLPALSAEAAPGAGAWATAATPVGAP